MDVSRRACFQSVHHADVRGFVFPCEVKVLVPYVAMGTRHARTCFRTRLDRPKESVHENQLLGWRLQPASERGEGIEDDARAFVFRPFDAGSDSFQQDRSHISRFRPLGTFAVQLERMDHVQMLQLVFVHA